MKKITIALVMVLMMMSFAYATVSRSVSNNVITYSSTLSGSLPKGYWAIYEPVSGCSVTSVSESSANAECSYISSDTSIRCVSYTLEAGGGMPTSLDVTVSGSGSCSLASGQFVEAYNDGSTSDVGVVTSISGSASVDLSPVSSCASGADTDGNSAVDWTEINAAIGNWLSGVLDWTGINNAVGEWINGC